MIGNIVAGTLSIPAPPIPPSDFESIQTVTVGSGGASTVTFDNIPQTFQHLQIRWMVRTNRSGSTGDYSTMRFNQISSSASYYSQHNLRGNGSVAAAGADGADTFCYIERHTSAGTLADTFGVGIVDILDYTNTNKNKVWRNLAGYDDNSGTDNVTIRLASGMLLSTPAISRIDFAPGVGSLYVQYSQFALYGIKG